MIDNYGCDHYKYNGIMNINHDGKELKNLNDIRPLNKVCQHLEQTTSFCSLKNQESSLNAAVKIKIRL